MSDPTWRLLIDAHARGAWNMGVDEVLLDGVALGTAPPTVRFYQWQPACLSLGYFQPPSVVNLEGCRTLGVDVVRRPTGGRAILHDRELTYSVAMPVARLGHDQAVLSSYRRLSLGILVGLRALQVPVSLAPAAIGTGPEHGPACFDRASANELLLHGRKLVGSAQVRRNGAVLQHGSILFEPQVERLSACLHLPEDQQPPGYLGSHLAGLCEVGAFKVRDVASAVGRGLAEQFGIQLEPGALEPAEAEAAGRLAASRYADAAWMAAPALAEAGNTTRTR